MTYACRDRAPFVDSFPAQDGYRADGARNMVLIPFRMAQDCRYQANDQYSDPQCVGCKHKDLPKGAQ